MAAEDDQDTTGTAAAVLGDGDAVPSSPVGGEGAAEPHTTAAEVEAWAEHVDANQPEQSSFTDMARRLTERARAVMNLPWGTLYTEGPDCGLAVDPDGELPPLPTIEAEPGTIEDRIADAAAELREADPASELPLAVVNRDNGRFSITAHTGGGMWHALGTMTSPPDWTFYSGGGLRNPWHVGHGLTSASITFTNMATTAGTYYYTPPRVERSVLDQIGRDVAAATDRAIHRAVLYDSGLTQPEPEPDDVRARRLERQRQMEQRQAADRERRATATARARETLFRFLTPAQREQYESTGRFEVIGSAGGRYSIGPGSQGNVHWLDDDGTFLGELCAHPTELADAAHPHEEYRYRRMIPEPDVHLAQMLHLLTDERGWVDTANVHSGRGPRFDDQGRTTTGRPDRGRRPEARHANIIANPAMPPNTALIVPNHVPGYREVPRIRETHPAFDDRGWQAARAVVSAT